MKETTDGLNKRLIDRMQAFKELAIIQDKAAACLAMLTEIAEEEKDNKLLSKAAQELIPAAKRFLDTFNFPLIEIMLDGDPRYYGDEEE